jgi:hypothetical protein
MSLRTSSLIALLVLNAPAWVHAGEASRAASDAPRLVGSWQCSAASPDGTTLDALPAFTFSLGNTAKSSFGGSAQGQGTWEQTGPRAFRSQQQVIAAGLVASLDAALTLPPGGPLQLVAQLVVSSDPRGSQQLDLVGTCTRLEAEPVSRAAAGGGSVVGSWFCRDDAVGDLTFGITFELGETFLATPGLIGHGAWRRTGRSAFASRDAVALAPFGFLLFDSAYELERGGALTFERNGFVVDPATGERTPVNQQSGSCQRIEVGAR